MARKPKPPAAIYTISVPDGVYGREVIATVTPVPPPGLFVLFDIRGDGWAALNWVAVDGGGHASQYITAPTYQGGPGTGHAYVADGISWTSTPLSNTATFAVAAP